MSDRKIVVKIDAMGNPTVEAQNFEGMDCTSATAGIEAALGGTGERTLKAEYYEEGDEKEEVTESLSW